MAQYVLYFRSLFLALLPQTYEKVMTLLLFCHSRFPKRSQELWVWLG